MCVYLYVASHIIDYKTPFKSRVQMVSSLPTALSKNPLFRGDFKLPKVASRTWNMFLPPIRL